ncbi:hypothetical protein KDW72_gp11 [Mycobacterium phage Grizzly]|uniref:Head-to-tail connector protein n=1 Tax=Mycobacterium phage Grizzly TaxID=2315539 RepID=A0A386KEI3_9CAUD|nr:hypothetical protein KDW72_gp11 [Mycobacterium phage Grizzly]AYD83975.1 hypothetical protein SEA_GRIZZLY_11 [Mycobacterium phage Grizzly]
MGKLKIPISDDKKIRRSSEVRKACQKIGATIAVTAGRIAGDSDGYGVEESVGSDRTRVNVYAQHNKTVKAEAGATPPLQQAAMRVRK